jgi:hypothetical protein
METFTGSLLALDAIAWGYVLLAGAMLAPRTTEGFAPTVAIIAFLSVGLPMYLQSRRFRKLALAVAIGSLALCATTYFVGFKQIARSLPSRPSVRLWQHNSV